MIIIEEFTQNVKKRLVSVIENGKENKDKRLRKVCDQCIKIIDGDILREDLLNISLEMVQSALKEKDDPFYYLLLALLYENLEDEEQGIHYMEEFSRTSLAENFRDELNDYRTYTKFFGFGDGSLLEEVGLSIISKHANAETVSDVLWMLTEYAKMPEYLDAYLVVANKAKELYPDVFRIDFFLGRIYYYFENYEKALNALMNYKNGVEKETDNPLYHCELANICRSIADVYLKLGNPQNAITNCNDALNYDAKSEDYSIEIQILSIRAKAYILLKEADLATTDINKILAEDPNDENALKLLEEIKKQ
jgi:tetratricopeptide (TPR) repeat protein